MPFSTINPNDVLPENNSLIVCAGTITCDKVKDMGSGFLVFKKIFNKNVHFNSNENWQTVLNKHLKDYHSKKEPMPPYIRMAQQDGYIGGVATVPVKNSKGLSFKKYLDNNERDKAFKEQYKQAVGQSIKDALELNRPLYIQPLGIGVYGWPPEEAAELFAKMIVENDPDDKLNITIPIFATSPTSKDKLFEKALIEELAKHQRHPVQTSETKPAKNSEPQPQQKKAQEVKKEIKEQEKKEKEDVTNQQKLVSVVATLINNIETKQGTRWTSGKDSQKVNDLKELKQSISETTAEQWDEKESEFLLNTLKICERKRNPIHFWSTPESVTEFKTLLAENGLELPSKSDSDEFSKS
ncbi:hypothetical protein LEAN103870_10605 [Legionella anisa]|nr:hypothetical protein [Legionella anisa]KTC77700.1 hypothetical protein Lani_0258 [Legionella anisa]MBN5937601.1 hypothetical protein [Legionella anisa]MCW8424971.1 hypothetical protein [Legionella anisa]MCW8445909.1 hypothetical protein [Legionella anisa]UAK80046.1 hypothetical protein K8O89_02895 [Legionella anisa]